MTAGQKFAMGQNPRCLLIRQDMGMNSVGGLFPFLHTFTRFQWTRSKVDDSGCW